MEETLAVGAGNVSLACRMLHSFDAERPLLRRVGSMSQHDGTEYGRGL